LKKILLGTNLRV